MCGICGVVNLETSSNLVSLPLLRSMASTLIHRGPDSDGYYISSDHTVGLGFRRLQIIDLSTGDQPIPNEDNSIQVISNGEIYNFQELRKRLKALGHVFRTRTDTEVIVHAYEQYGDGCVEHFRGMFAFALWDQRNRRLLLARDRVGKKPLYYYHHPRYFVFGSELKSLLRHPGVPTEIDPEALELYWTYGYIPAPWTILSGVHKLPPAHYLVVDLEQNRVETKRYWDPEYLPKLDITQVEASEQFLFLLKEAVRLRMVSDVPLGALLSGGIDSSLIVALMSEQAGQPIETFTIGFEEASHDERPFANIVAQRYETKHHEYVVRPNVAEVLPELVWYLDEPMADSSALPTYYVAQMARQQVTVVLNGDGGDENFGGYRHYRSVLNSDLFNHLPGGIRNGVIRPIAYSLMQNFNHSLFRRLFNLAEHASWPTWAKHEHRMFMFREPERKLLVPGERSDQNLTRNYFRDVYERGICDNSLDAMLRADILSVLPGDLLVKMDRMSMAHSLEARSPFLDHELIEFVAKLPTQFKVTQTKRKALLQRVAKEYLPPELLKRKKKGFSVPIHNWLERDFGDRIPEILLDKGAQIREFVSPKVLESLFDSSPQKVMGHQLWALLVFEFWLSEVLKKSIERRRHYE